MELAFASLHLLWGPLIDRHAMFDAIGMHA